MAVWGAGQLVPWERWYLHGITMGDIVFLIYLVSATVLSKGFRTNLISILRDNQFYVISILGMVAMLLFATWLNADKYIISSYHIVSVLRSGYFLLVSLVVIHWAKTNNISALCKSFLFGLIIAWLWQFTISSISPDDVSQVKCGYFVMHNPNVFGNMLGIGIIFCSVLAMERDTVIAYLMSLLLAYLSLYCFSKGTWGMVVAGMLALIFASLNVVKMTIDPYVRRRVAMQLAMIAAMLVALFIAIAPTIVCLLESKIAAQEASGSIELRKDYLRNSTEIALKNFFGVGVGRILDIRTKKGINQPIDQNYILRDDDSYGFVGFSSRGNPHSAFLYLLVHGGILSLIFFLLALGYPLFKLWRSSLHSVFLYLYLFFILITLLISGAFQLQIYAQHFYWVLAGLMIAMASKNHPRYYQPAPGT